MAFLQRRPNGSFQANVSIRHTAADASGSVVWALHVPTASKKKLLLQFVNLVMSFDGTATAATSVAYELIRHSQATGAGIDPTGGTTVPRIKKKSKYDTSVITDTNIQQKSGILTFAPTFDSGPFHVIRLPIAATNGILEQRISFGSHDPEMIREPHVFFPDEGWAIRLHVIAVVGLSLSGSFEWDEIDITH